MFQNVIDQTKITIKLLYLTASGCLVAGKTSIVTLALTQLLLYFLLLLLLSSSFLVTGFLSSLVLLLLSQW
jgi:hypothetical protein